MRWGLCCRLGFNCEPKLDDCAMATQLTNNSVKVMETAKAHFESGRADLVVAELGPLLLDEAGVAGKGPLSRPKSILEGLQVLQVSPSQLLCCMTA